MSDVLLVQQICKTPSISLGVLHEGQVIFRQSIGFGDVEGNQRANSDTSYLIGSCSKLFTSAALGLLVNDGTISWNDPLSKHLPNFNPIEDPEIGKKATIRDACRHSTGLANPNAVFLGPQGITTVKAEDHIAMVNCLPTSNSSGQRFNSWWYYSNAAFGLLSQVIEAASSTQFAAFLQQRLCKPLGLSQTLLSETSVQSNPNVAHPYVQKQDGSWSRIRTEVTSEKHAPVLACMGIRTSVNDTLKFCKAVVDCYQTESGSNSELEPATNLLADNPLKEITSLWGSWWGRPHDDGYDNNTAYTLGWVRTTMPTSALGMFSYNTVQGREDIVGRESESRTLYGHAGVTNGSLATIWVLPNSRSAIVVLSNAADAGDASDTTAQILLQALYDLKPPIDLLPALRASRDDRLKMHDDMIDTWKRNRDTNQYAATSIELIGTYVGLGTSVINIVKSDTSTSGLAVVFAGKEATHCQLEPYNTDALSFLPMHRHELLARGMIDWDYWTVGIFRFVREDEAERKGFVIGLRWKWDKYDYPGLWVKTSAGMSNAEYDAIIQKHSTFLKTE
jgi:CubicO group peptidase (beta-lactamase class C family)